MEYAMDGALVLFMVTASVCMIAMLVSEIRRK